MKLPILTKNRLKGLGWNKKLTEKQRRIMKQGYVIEMEHFKQGDNEMLPYKVVLDHIREHGWSYYDKLKKCKIE